MKPVLFCSLVVLFMGEFCHGCPFHSFGNSTGPAGLTVVANATMSCAKKLGMDLHTLNSDMFKDPDVDDKCLGKCLLQHFELVSDTKLFDRDAFFELLEDQAPKSLLIKLTEIVNKCADSTEVDVRPIQPKINKVSPTLATGAGSCKTYHAFLVCFNTNAEKNTGFQWRRRTS